jgi:hypothetical protein
MKRLLRRSSAITVRDEFAQSDFLRRASRYATRAYP